MSTTNIKYILSLSHLEARKFFMKHDSYCNLALPPYVSFDSILNKLSSLLKDKTLSENGKYSFQKSDPAKQEKMNHSILYNKDGKYAWRSMELIHPALYMSLVHNITKKEHWKTIQERFKKFKENNSHIKCMSIPLIPPKKKKTNAEQILVWWKEVEQQSIKLSLEYEYLTHTDISNCYGAVYTHSIPWAIHGKKEAKANRTDKHLIGNIIDKHLRDMSYGQTNGIPQGSVLMDFIAEMVLGYIDCELTKKIKKDTDIKNDCYNIIRYRDDYRIFTNSLRDGEKIIKLISETLIDFGMSLNPNKTKQPTDQIIRGSIKPDKLYWIQKKQRLGCLQNHLIFIHSFSKKFPNSGSLIKALVQFYDKIEERTIIEDVYLLISIIVDIAYHNPRTYHISAPIISQLIQYIDKKTEQKNIIEKIREKFKKIPNTGYLDIWLQRVVIGFDKNTLFNKSIRFDEPICKIVPKKDNISIWNLDWLKDNFKQIIEDTTIVDRKELERLRGKPIKSEEFAIFSQGY